MMAEIMSAFEELYADNYEKLYKLAYRLAGNKEDAEDLLQESFLRAFKAFAQFERRSEFSTWMYRIIINCSGRFLKKQKALPVEDISKRLGVSCDDFLNSIKTDETVENIVVVDDLRENCLQMFLNCMPRQQRISFVLKIIMELSVADVAQIMNISGSSVKVNVYRARQSMKENMAGKCSFIRPENPCQCKNWVVYAVKNGQMDIIPKAPHMKDTRYNELFTSEMDFLGKLRLLYGGQPGSSPSSEFIQQMKQIIAQNELKVLM